MSSLKSDGTRTPAQDTPPYDGEENHTQSDFQLNAHSKILLLSGLGALVGFALGYGLGDAMEIRYANHVLDIRLSAGLFGTLLGHFTAQCLTPRPQTAATAAKKA